MTGDVNRLVRNRHLVESLEQSLRSGRHGLSVVPGLLKRLLAEGSWREFTTQRGDLVRYERFADFVTTPPLKGLGSDVDLIRRVIGNDIEALDLLDQALESGGRQGERTDLLNNVKEVAEHPRGNSAEYALRKLRRSSPELHADVLAGRLTAHAAMVKAGYRHKTISVPVDDPAATARTLRKQYDANQLAQLVTHLTASEG